MASEDKDEARRALSRRVFLRGAGEMAAGGVLVHGLAASCGAPAESQAASDAARPASAPTTPLEGEVEIELAINGTKRRVVVEPRTTLLDSLRNRLEPALTGTKLVCDRGNCGACTVLVDGEPRYSCLQLAVDVRGRAITTVEGLAPATQLSELQEELVAHDGSMCGFCTSGFVVSITSCLKKNPRADDAEIRASCAGNACRCGTYPQVFEAALAAGRRIAKG